MLEVVIKKQVGSEIAFETQIAIDKFTTAGWGRTLAVVIADIAAWMPGDDETQRKEMLHAMVQHLASIPNRTKTVQ
ncbi:MAG: hypothetical protein ACRD3I_01820 [Terriglobales bacterium]